MFLRNQNLWPLDSKSYIFKSLNIIWFLVDENMATKNYKK